MSEPSIRDKGKYIPPQRRIINQSDDLSFSLQNSNLLSSCHDFDLLSLCQDSNPSSSNLLSSCQGFNSPSKQCNNEERGDQSRQKRNNNEILKNRHRDFSQGSKFNTKQIFPEKEAELKRIEPGPIIIPEMIVPLVVESVDTINFDLEDKDDDLDEIVKQYSETINNSPGEVLKQQRRGKMPMEREQTNFDEWRDHYRVDLEQMYNTYLSSEFKLSFERFVQLAYQCTDKEFNKNTFVHSYK
jgi:hypothetical protein